MSEKEALSCIGNKSNPAEKLSTELNLTHKLFLGNVWKPQLYATTKSNASLCSAFAPGTFEAIISIFQAWKHGFGKRLGKKESTQKAHQATPANSRP